MYTITEKLSEVNYKIEGVDLPSGKVVHYNALQKILQENQGPPGDTVHLSELPTSVDPPADMLEDVPR